MTDRILALLLRSYVVLLFIFIFAPFFVLILFAFNKSRFPYLPWQGFSLDWFRSLQDPAILAAFQNSLIVALVSACIAAPIGCAAAYFVNRWEFSGKNVYLGLALSPPCIPLIVLALTFLIYFRELGISKTLGAVVVAHVVISCPFAFGVMRLRLAALDPDLEKAAWNLGASEWMAIRTILLPQAMSASIAAFLLSMSVSWDEFTIAWFVSGLDITLPVYLWNSFQGQISAQINAIGSVAFLVSILLVATTEILIFSRRHGSTKQAQGQ